MPSVITATGQGIEIAVRALPRANRSEIVGPHGGALKVRLAAPPVDGRANAELVRLVAKALHVPRSAVEVRRGRGGRSKVVRVRGVELDEARTRLGL